MRKRVEVEFAIDDLKAVKIAGKLHDLFYNRRGFFEDYSMPEYILPRNLKEGSREHALFLTYVISIDYMTDAEKLWKKSRGAYELYPERFTTEKVLEASSKTVETFVRNIGARFGSTAAKIWKNVSRVLVDKYSGDPRNITDKPLTIEEIKERVNDLPSLRGPKLSNFYIRAMGEKELFKVKNLNELDIPVDKQVARFTIYTGVLKLLSEQFVGCAQDQPLRGLIEESWRNAAKTLSVAPWKLDEPIWTVGSKLCSGRKCWRCPVDSMCGKTSGITFRENTVVWKPAHAQSDKKIKTRKKEIMPTHGYVVFEDLAGATGPKLHSLNCVYYKRWLLKPTETTKWHGPFDSDDKAWRICKEIASKRGFAPKKHKCTRT